LGSCQPLRQIALWRPVSFMSIHASSSNDRSGVFYATVFLTSPPSTLLLFPPIIEVYPWAIMAPRGHSLRGRQPFTALPATHYIYDATIETCETRIIFITDKLIVRSYFMAEINQFTQGCVSEKFKIFLSNDHKDDFQDV